MFKAKKRSAWMQGLLEAEVLYKQGWPVNEIVRELMDVDATQFIKGVEDYLSYVRLLEDNWWEKHPRWAICPAPRYVQFL